MRADVQCAVVLTVCMALIPCLVFTGIKKTDEDMKVRVYLNHENKVVEYPLEEYIVGAVLAQMPADFNEEALKAQAVLARTYIYRRTLSEEKDPTPSLHGAVISDDDNIYQSFFTPEEAKDHFGSNHDKVRRRVLKAVRKAPWILTYKGEPVTAAYHSASSGSTESALCAWGQDIPYLQPADSGSDALLKGIESDADIFYDEMRDIADECFGITLNGTEDKWLVTEKNERGYVTSAVLCGTEVDVQKFVSACGIASPCFTFRCDDSSIVFTAKGYGHMVGMSQYGANTMAENGSSCEEILDHYFKGCTLKKTEKDPNEKVS